MLSHLVLALPLLGPFGSGVPQDGKPSPPGASEERKARAELHSLFKEEYQARTTEDILALARTLLKHGRATKNDPVSRYVLLTDARDYALKALDLETAADAIEELGTSHNVDLATLRAELIAAAKKRVRSRDDVRALASFCLTLGNTLAGANRYGEALEHVGDAESLAKKARDPELAKKANARAKELKELSVEFEDYKKAELSLSVAPDDPEANLIVGMFQCFVLGEPPKGWPYLKKGSDPSLAKMADRELLGARDSAGQYGMGVDWEAIAKKERSPVIKGRYQSRALHWYESALAGAAGIERIRVDKAVARLEKILHPGRVNLLRLIDPEKDGVQGPWSLREGVLIGGKGMGSVRVKIPYAPPDEYDLHVVLRRMGCNDAVVLGLVSGGHRWTLRVDSHPGKGYLTGIEMLDGAFQDQHEHNVTGRRLEDGRDYTLDVFVRKDSVSLSIDESPVYLWKGDLGRLSLSSLWPISDRNAMSAGAWGGGVAFKAMYLTPVAGVGKHLR